MTTVRRFFVILLVLGAALPAAGPAEAMNQGTLGVISPDDPLLERELGPILGFYTAARAPLPQDVCDTVGRCGAEPFAAFRPVACRTANYCDTITLDVDYPDGYIYDVFFGVAITLTWDNPRTEDNPTGNDVDLFLWPDDDPTSGAPVSECGAPGVPACDNLFPEVIIVIEPEDTIPPEGDEDADDLPPMLFTVVNHFGANTGYTLRAEWFTFDVDFEDFSKQGRPGGPVIGPGSDAGKPPAGFDPATLRGVQGPKADRKILIPGPDGEFVEMELPLLAAGKVLDPPDERGGLNPIVIAGAGIGAAGLGLGTATVIRRRRLSRRGI